MTERDGTSNDDLPTQRFKQLVARLATEIGHRRGWQSVVSRRIGIHRSTLLRVMAGERAVTATLIERVCDSLGIDPVWFTDPDAVAPARLRGSDETPDLNDVQRAWVDAARIAAEIRDADDERDALRRLLVALERVPVFQAYYVARTALEGAGDVGPAASNLEGALAVTMHDIAANDVALRAVAARRAVIEARRARKRTLER